MSGFQTPVTFDTANRKKDKSIGLRFTTNLELTTAEYMELDKLVQQSGWLLFKPNEIQPSDIPDVPADEAYGKMTPSQETRWLLKKLWEQNSQDLDWPDYYRSKMAAINEQLREKLA